MQTREHLQPFSICRHRGYLSPQN